MRIELGHSILEGELITRRLQQLGLRVALLRNEHPETGANFGLGGCTLLVAPEDEPAVREHLAESGY